MISTLNINRTKNRNKSGYKIIGSTKGFKDSVQLKNLIKDREGILPYTCHANIEIKKEFLLIKKRHSRLYKIKFRNLGFNTVEVKIK